MKQLIIFSLSAFFYTNAIGQATFMSAISGNYNEASSWTLASGRDEDGIPDANDDIVIQSGHVIRLTQNNVCNNFTAAMVVDGESNSRTATTGGTLLLGSNIILVNGAFNYTYIDKQGTSALDKGKGPRTIGSGTSSKINTLQ